MLPYFSEEKKAGDLYLVLVFCSCCYHTKSSLVILDFVIKRKKLDIPRHATECIWNLLEGDHFLLRNIEIQFCGIGRL